MASQLGNISQPIEKTCNVHLQIALALAEGQAVRQVLCKRLQLVDKLMLRLLCMHDPGKGPQDALRGINWHCDNCHIAVVDI